MITGTATGSRASVEVAAGGFRGEVAGNRPPIRSWPRSIAKSRLAGSLAGEARLATMEEWLSIVVTGDGRGHIELSCEVRDQPGIGNRLAFRLALDQTTLRPMVAQLGRAVSEFPVIGRPDSLTIKDWSPRSRTSNPCSRSPVAPPRASR